MVLAAGTPQTGAMSHRNYLLSFLFTTVYLQPGLGQIRVRLYDYAGVNPETLRKAKVYARETLSAAGVEVEWADCSSDPASSKSETCRLPITTLDLQVRIVNRYMAKRVPTSRFCLGYAILGAQFPSIASVFHHRAIDLEEKRLTHRASILAAMIAHEIGHLLLNEHNHSRQGIMRGVWDDGDLRIIAKGRMSFLRKEAERLAASVAQRQDFLTRHCGTRDCNKQP